MSASGAWTGFRPGVVLLRLRLAAPAAGTWWIREDYVDVDSLRAGSGNGATCWIGEDVPRTRWCTPWHGLWLPVRLEAGENLVHLEIVERTGRLGISVQLEPDGIRQSRAENAALRDGLLVGLLLANLLLATFLFALVRHRAHFWYLVYQAVVIVFVFGNHQHSFAWLWPSHPDLNQISPSFGSIGAFGALALFLTHLLDLHGRYPVLGRFFRTQGVVLVGLCALQLLIPVMPGIVDALYAGPQMEILEISSYLLGIALVGRLALGGNRQARATAVAMVPMILALGLSLGGELVHLPWMYSMRGVVVEVAMCIENILLSLMLVWKVGLERREHQGLLERHLALEKAFNDRLVHATDQHLRGTALDLHDGVGQDLAALRIQAEMMGPGDVSGTFRSRFDAELARVADSVRSTAHGLYPPELHDGKVNTALQLLGERLRANAILELVVEGGLDGLSEPQALHWYRIAQEAIQNAQKHGKARVVAIRLQRDRMEIEDDGIGFPAPPQDGMGLRTIRTRAAQLGCQVRLAKGSRGGCRIEIAPFLV